MFCGVVLSECLWISWMCRDDEYDRIVLSIFSYRRIDDC